MKSVLIMVSNGPFGSNSTYEAIRLGSGFLGLGEDIETKVVLYGDAVMMLSSKTTAEPIGMDALDEGLEMADLTEMPLCVISEDLAERGLTKDDLIEYDELEIISVADMPKIIGEFDAVMHM